MYKRQPLGLVIGVLIGFIGCPDGFRIKTTVIYAVLIAAVAFVTCLLYTSYSQTMIIVTHDERIAAMADRIIQMGPAGRRSLSSP